jgi:hypothetical protein
MPFTTAARLGTRAAVAFIRQRKHNPKEGDS